MDWQQVTQSFLPLTREQTSAFASPREMDSAIATYNRAIRNLGQDSADVALIALRKLAASHPRFQEASLLYGCCLARTGELAAARQQLISVRKLPDLAPDLAEATDAALEMVAADLANAAAPTDPRPADMDRMAEQLAAADLPPGSAPVVLERLGRGKAVRMASERERREILRKGEAGLPEETHVVVPRTTFETVQAALPAAAIVLTILVLSVLGFRFLPGLLARQSRTDTEERLAYLLTRLEQRAQQDPQLQGILADYSQRFEPAGQASSANPAADPSPGASTVPSIAPTTALAVGTLPPEPTAAAPTTPAETTPATAPPTSGAPTEPAATTAPATAPAPGEPTASPTPAIVTPAPTTTPTTTPTASPTPAVTPAPGQATDPVIALATANGLYQEGLAVKPTDVVGAAERFSQSVQLLANVPPETTAPGVSQSAGQLRADAQSQFSGIARTAALRLRSEAQALFDRGQVAEALPVYLRAYAIQPDSYGGGVAYYCGRCHQLLGQPDQARPYYQYVIAHFPGRDIATSASVRLREMGG